MKTQEHKIRRALMALVGTKKENKELEHVEHVSDLAILREFCKASDKDLKPVMREVREKLDEEIEENEEGRVWHGHPSMAQKRMFWILNSPTWKHTLGIKWTGNNPLKLYSLARRTAKKYLGSPHQLKFGNRNIDLNKAKKWAIVGGALMLGAAFVGMLAGIALPFIMLALVSWMICMCGWMLAEGFDAVSVMLESDAEWVDSLSNMDKPSILKELAAVEGVAEVYGTLDGDNQNDPELTVLTLAANG